MRYVHELSTGTNNDIVKHESDTLVKQVINQVGDGFDYLVMGSV